MSGHVITVTSFPYFSAGTVYVAVCSCGRYRSGKHCWPGHAEAAGRDHVKAKTGSRT